MNRLIAGAAAGAAATVPMTMFWEVMHRHLDGEPPRPLPPREVAEALAVKAGVSRELDEVQMERLAMALHFAAHSPALFGLIAPRREATRGIGANAGRSILDGSRPRASGFATLGSTRADEADLPRSGLGRLRRGAAVAPEVERWPRPQVWVPWQVTCRGSLRGALLRPRACDRRSFCRRRALRLAIAVPLAASGRADFAFRCVFARRFAGAGT